MLNMIQNMSCLGFLHNKDLIPCQFSIKTISRKLAFIKVQKYSLSSFEPKNVLLIGKFKPCINFKMNFIDLMFPTFADAETYHFIVTQFDLVRFVFRATHMEKDILLISHQEIENILFIETLNKFGFITAGPFENEGDDFQLTELYKKS